MMRRSDGPFPRCPLGRRLLGVVPVRVDERLHVLFGISAMHGAHHVAQKSMGNTGRGTRAGARTL
jgi:hypothetical protein